MKKIFLAVLFVLMFMPAMVLASTSFGFSFSFNDEYNQAIVVVPVVPHYYYTPDYVYHHSQRHFRHNPRPFYHDRYKDNHRRYHYDYRGPVHRDRGPQLPSNNHHEHRGKRR